ncbi:alpha,alpha-trehalase [Starmerella bacillaris]|uniref:Trehalase n=1 Tax=Starmerella bacillaris TaxID=1247836 RepID=A0AAV5RLD8_STABA|nr:alpha,alpha-trehalase [Starmerella bacillaris]
MDAGAGLRESIRNRFWRKLERVLTKAKVEHALRDSKRHTDEQSALFVPPSQKDTHVTEYYKDTHEIIVKCLPEAKDYTNDFLYKAGHEPGILSLAFEKDRPIPFMIPGCRFNEFYGWDSYFIARGLVQDGYYDMARGVIKQFAFELFNYGKILNANRPYYLGRTQPPFVSDLAWALEPIFTNEFVEWINAAIFEYNTVWMVEPRLDLSTGLSRYYAQGRGVPPEVEEHHFDKELAPYAKKYNLTIDEFVHKYDMLEIEEPELDTFFLHDRSLRESGHDVTSRFVYCCADLVTVDLNSLLYKYEMDICRAIQAYPDSFPGESAKKWRDRAKRRKKLMNELLWDDVNGVFYDYDIKAKKPHNRILSATTFWPLWAGLATQEQAARLVKEALPRLEGAGGLASTSKLEDNGWQWDYPACWAPHQLLAWEGLEKYGYHQIAERLASKWLNQVCKSYKITDGVVYEKYDVRDVPNPHAVMAEYGNQGSSESGFGWTNAVFAIGWDKYCR